MPAGSFAERSTKCFRRSGPAAVEDAARAAGGCRNRVRTAPPTGCAASPRRPAWRRAQRRATRIGAGDRPGADLAAADAAVQVLAEGVTLANFEGASFKSAPDTTWLADGRAAGRRRARRLRRARRAGPDDGRVLQRGADDGQRTRQPPDAAHLRRARRGAGAAGRAQGRRARRDADCGAEHGAAARRHAGQPGAAAPAGAANEPAGRRVRRHARPDRQGHHVRHRRHLDQAGREHGQDEGRHVRRRRGDCARCWPWRV